MKNFERTRADIILLSRVLIALVAGVLPFANAFAVDVDNSGDIVVTDVHGSVTVAASDRNIAIRVGSVIAPPATIRTGADGAIDLRQGQTTVAIGANTGVDLPATSVPGAALDRIVQLTGSALYKVGKREAHKLRVETPHLVAVIKGTQFNVLAQSDRTTIALFEGKLDVRLPDDSDITDLNAGEIAVHRSGDPTIRVLRMDTGQTLRGQADQPAVLGAPQLAAAGAAAAGNTLGAGVTTTTTNGPSRTETVATARSTEVNIDNGAASASVGVSSGDNAVGATTKVQVSGGAAPAVNAGLQANVSAAGTSASVGANVGVSTSNGASVSAGASVGANVGNAVSASTSTAGSASVAPTNVSVAATTGTGVTVSAPAADVGANVSNTTSLGATVGGGATAVTASTNTNVTASTPVANVGVGATTAVSATPTDLSASTSASVSAGSTNVAATANVGTSGVNVGANVAGATVGASVTPGNVNVSLGGLNVNLGNSPTATTTSTTATTSTPGSTTNDSTTPESPHTGLLHNLIKLPGH